LQRVYAKFVAWDICFPLSIAVWIRQGIRLMERFKGAWFKRAPFIILSAVILLLFWKIVFTSEYTLLGAGDMASQTYPWFSAAGHWLRKGVLLLWDPYVYAGKPNLGELQTGLLYPLNWLVMLLPSGRGTVSLDGLQALILIHHTLAACFCYLLTRRLGLARTAAILAAIVFSIGGFMTQLRGYFNIFGSFTWMPLALFLYSKSFDVEVPARRSRWLVGTAIAIGLSIMAGHHAAAVHTGLLLLLYTFFIFFRSSAPFSMRRARNSALGLGFVICLTALITAAQVLPSYEYARQALRWVGGLSQPLGWGEKIPYSVLGQTGNLEPGDILSLGFFTINSGHSIYIGAPVLFLAVTALLFVRKKEILFYGSVAVFYLLAALGSFTPVHGWLNSSIPGLWFAREVYLYLVPLHLCLSVLAGFGLNHWMTAYQTSPNSNLTQFLRQSGWFVAGLVLILVMIILYAVVVINMDLSHPYLRAAGHTAIFLLLLGILLLFLHTRRLSPAIFGCLLVVVITLDLSAHNDITIIRRGADHASSPQTVEQTWRKSPVQQFYQEKRKQEIFRVDDPFRQLPVNYGDVWRVEEALGHGATARRDYMEFRGLGWGPGSNASSLLNIRYWFSPHPIRWMEKVFGNTGDIYQNPRAQPRAFAVERFHAFADDSQSAAWIRSPLFAPGETVALRLSDLRLLPNEVRHALGKEWGGYRLQNFDYATADELAAKTMPDAEARHRAGLLAAPWGWSEGDRLSFDVIPDRPINEIFLCLNYYPMKPDSSMLKLRIATAEGEENVEAMLEGLRQEENPGSIMHRTFVRLGPLEAKSHRISLTKSAGCSAKIDSVRLSRRPVGEFPGTPGQVSMVSFKPNRILLHVSQEQPSLLVLGELYDPGWKAWVDGNPAPILAGNLVLRTIPVKSGEHRIELRYRPASFFWGGLASLLALAACLLFIIKDTIMKKEHD
jgi:hypothetical protein